MSKTSSPILIRCIDAARCQGSLTEGKLYHATGRVKMGKFEREIEVIDNNGKTKWFVISRFDVSDVRAFMDDTTSSKAVLTSEDVEEKKEGKEMKKTLSVSGLVSKVVEFLIECPEYEVNPVIRKAIIDTKTVCEGFEKGTPVFLVARRKDKATGYTYMAAMNGDYAIVSGYSINHFRDITDIDNPISEKIVEAINTLVASARKETKEAIKTMPVLETEKPAKQITEAPHVAKSTKGTFREFLEKQGVPSGLIKGLEQFREFYKLTDEKLLERVPKPKQLFIGGEVWTDALAALLSGENILLEGGKATGKNTLCENLSFAFGRPQWDISFHSNITASQLVGNDTFRNNEVVFNPGMMYLVGKHGGFGILDEINMAKSESIAIMHSALDNRRELDVPGYELLRFNEATRFIGTMNYGYSGTREMNEALVSRFTVIHVPELDSAQLLNLLKTNFPDVKTDVLQALVGLFTDLQTKAKNTEISTKAVDLRGIQSAIKLMKAGVAPKRALERGVVCKAFEESERQLVRDVVNTRIPSSWTASNVLTSDKSMTFDFSKVR